MAGASPPSASSSDADSGLSAEGLAGASSPPSAAEFGLPEEFQVDSSGAEMDPERLSEVTELVSRGNRAFRDGRTADAIAFYSKAHSLKPGDPVILSNRSAAFCRISRSLRNRPASESDYRPVMGLDPTTHAELALKDAEKLIASQSNSGRPFFLKADSLILLERYTEARDTLLLGLHIDPLSYPLQNALSGLERILGASLKRSKFGKLQLSDDFECTLCLKLLYEPVTTPCGHSFCRSCLFQSMDHGNKCPVCRTILFLNPRTCPISVTLNSIIQKHFPEEHAERKAEQGNLTNLGVDLMPLFVLDAVFPGQKLSLNIFEPRYRLMVRRVMEGNHRMGMASVDPTTGSIANFACEVEITECEPLPDGRFYIEVLGRRRFQILQSWDQDGYRVGEVEWIQDILPPDGSPEREDLLEMASGAADTVQTSRINGNASRRNDARSGNSQIEGMPSPADPETFSFWLVNQFQLNPQEKLELLHLRDTRERISRGLTYLREGPPRGCHIQ